MKFIVTAKLILCVEKEIEAIDLEDAQEQAECINGSEWSEYVQTEIIDDLWVEQVTS